MSLYTNFNYASLEEVYGGDFKKKNNKKQKEVIKDPRIELYNN